MAPQLLLLGFIVTLTGIPSDLFVAAGADRASGWIKRNSRLMRIQAWISGSILTGLGGYIAVTEIRRELALQYIQDRSKTLTEISFLLGFSEVSSFSRAYKGWTGKAPSQDRQDVA